MQWSCQIHRALSTLIKHPDSHSPTVTGIDIHNWLGKTKKKKIHKKGLTHGLDPCGHMQAMPHFPLCKPGQQYVLKPLPANTDQQLNNFFFTPKCKFYLMSTQPHVVPMFMMLFFIQLVNADELCQATKIRHRLQIHSTICLKSCLLWYIWFAYILQKIIIKHFKNNYRNCQVTLN